MAVAPAPAPASPSEPTLDKTSAPTYGLAARNNEESGDREMEMEF